MSFQAIWEALKGKIEELITSSRIATWSVYNYDVRIEDGLLTPAVIITPADGDEQIRDTANNESKIPFYIRVVDTWADGDREGMEDNMRELADLIMEKVKDVTIVAYSNGNARARSYSFERWWVDFSEPYRVFQITVNFICLETK